MCKITGFVGHKRVPDARATVERMTATLAHHGPDGQGARSQHLSDHPLAASLGKSMKDFTKGALGVGRRPQAVLGLAQTTLREPEPRPRDDRGLPRGPD